MNSERSEGEGYKLDSMKEHAASHHQDDSPMSASPSGLRRNVGRRLVQAPIHFYRKVISPLKPPTCRFYPTCSAYALEAVEVHGPAKGSWLALKRIGKCHLFHPGGFDPVPPRADTMAGQQELSDT
ncbi:putative membrane protein insertion efficiency factor [compost metagenome]